MHRLLFGFGRIKRNIVEEQCFDNQILEGFSSIWWVDLKIFLLKYKVSLVKIPHRVTVFIFAIQADAIEM